MIDSFTYILFVYSCSSRVMMGLIWLHCMISRYQSILYIYSTIRIFTIVSYSLHGTSHGASVPSQVTPASSWPIPHCSTSRVFCGSVFRFQRPCSSLHSSHSSLFSTCVPEGISSLLHLLQDDAQYTFVVNRCCFQTTCTQLLDASVNCLVFNDLLFSI